ncbi:CHASE2 domain-containing protein [Lyngbya sp. CCY1209]|uniref:CHASE2 domain-containing protein n=1 Tax=Lyngbya sp. CCY1209 TaxID=2886103 RepID=UPI002D207BD8|nr:CHASE2 domain-containing protein [Lyngbya sp. CCY1209]MEB3884538.1 EAL domain-containing protein [Lyngbya sp. CCY1209]
MPAQNSESAVLWLSKWRLAIVRIAPPLWLMISLVAIAGLVGVKQLGGLQPLELRLFDWRVRLRPEAEPDDRLLVVAITEADIGAQEQWPLPDALLAEMLANLQRHQPAAIGLDLYRDLPVGSGSEELAEQFRAPNLVAITKIGNPENPSIPPPPQLPPAQIGFNDLLLDPDGVVRRQLLFAEADGTYFSLALRLALLYLGDRGIEPKNSAENPNYMALENRVFVPLNSRDGGYATIDDRGYQILLNYRAAEAAPTVTLAEVLADAVDPALVTDKIVLIGATAPSIKDAFFTPYSVTQAENPKMPGVLIHANMVSQILGPEMDSARPSNLFWFWPEWTEILWVGFWGILGGFAAWRIRHPALQGLALILGLAVIWGTSFGLFLLNGWIPLASPVLALLVAGTGVVAYKQIHNVLHDPLTGLPNRALFLDRTEQAIARSKRNRVTCGVLFLNVDGFRLINDSLGNLAGDQLLLQLVGRLKTCVRMGDIIARLGGDEFAILLEHLQSVENATAVAERIQQALVSPFILDGHDVFKTVSIGIALADTAETRSEDLLRNSNTAMQRAKSLKNIRYQVFERTMQVGGLERLQLETDLRLAVSRQEFVMYYQPVISLEMGQIVGFEALVRWRHPRQGLVTPDRFLKVAKETGLIIPIGRWALQEACRQIAIWQDRFESKYPIIVGVNLSARQFMHPDLVSEIREIIRSTAIAPERLRLEVTESVIMDDVEMTIALLHQLKELDVKLSIDDFGTGFSSLGYLPRFPVDVLKIDRSFIGRMEENSEGDNLAIVRTILMLSRALNLDAIAEGVETERQLKQLRSLGCKYVQGYYFQRPIPADAATEFFESDPKW